MRLVQKIKTTIILNKKNTSKKKIIKTNIYRSYRFSLVFHRLSKHLHYLDYLDDCREEEEKEE